MFQSSSIMKQVQFSLNSSPPGLRRRVEQAYTVSTMNRDKASFLRTESQLTLEVIDGLLQFGHRPFCKLRTSLDLRRECERSENGQRKKDLHTKLFEWTAALAHLFQSISENFDLVFILILFLWILQTENKQTAFLNWSSTSGVCIEMHWYDNKCTDPTIKKHY